MYPMLEQELAVRPSSRPDRAGARRPPACATRAPSAGAARRVPDVDVAIREAETGDMPALMRLAELDSRDAAERPQLLVAEVGRPDPRRARGRGRRVDREPVRGRPAELAVAAASCAPSRSRRERAAARRGGLLGALHLRPRAALA